MNKTKQLVSKSKEVMSMYCYDCDKEQEIISLGEVWYGTKYEDGREYQYYPLLECGHYGYISTSPIGNTPPNAEELLDIRR